MNLVLLFESDFIQPGKVRVSGRRHRHILEVQRATVGKKLCVGLCDGLIGEGTVTMLDDRKLEMEVVLNREPPAPLPVTLILALPRPNVLKRALITTASMGVKRLILLHFNRVEKSLWQSSALEAEAVREQLILGLEQARDTVLPEVILRKRFKPFVEDELPGMIAGTRLLVAHPESAIACPPNLKGPVVLVIGPEGGLVPFELEQLGALGFESVHLGERILRVDAAVPALLARLFHA